MSLLLHGLRLSGFPLLTPNLMADSQVLPLVQAATPVALQITGYVLPFASGLLARLKTAM